MLNYPNNQQDRHCHVLLPEYTHQIEEQMTLLSNLERVEVLRCASQHERNALLLYETLTGNARLTRFLA